LRLVKAELKLVLIFGTGSRTRTSSKSRIGIFFPIPKLELYSWFYLCVEPILELNLFGELYLKKLTTIIGVNCWIQFKLPRTGLEKLKWIFKSLF
jgi:hypothetical protein